MNHGELKSIFSSWSRQGSPIHQNLSVSCPMELVQFAQLFVAIQEARHKADYDFTLTFKRSHSRP
jgi:hypothetical protein